MATAINSATILTIGDELLIGQTIDTNSSWMGEELTKLGVQVIEKVTIRDEHESIIEAIDNLSGKADILLITGGLGPTKDDITKKAIADFLDCEMEFDEGTWKKIEGFFKKLGRPTTEAHKVQCYMPEMAHLLDNNMGTAPGMLFNYEGMIIISMPGVPYEMKYIMSNSVLPMIASRTSITLYNHTLQTIGRGESMIADEIADIVDSMPDNMSMAYLPSLGTVRLRISSTGHEADKVEHEVQQYTSQIKDRLGDLIFGEGKTSIAEALGDLYKEKGLTLSTAESCTGGRVGAKIVEIPGSSIYYLGSIVSYSYEMKKSLLSVKPDTLTNFGAVSEETVIEMVAGTLQQIPSDVCIAISGIAGPGGGTETKPVGTIWMAVGDKNRTHTRLLKTGKDRKKNIEYASNIALDMLRKFALKHY